MERGIDKEFVGVRGWSRRRPKVLGRPTTHSHAHALIRLRCSLGGHGHRGGAGPPAGRTGRERHALGDHLVPDVQALVDQDVGVLGHRSGQGLVGSSLGGGGLLGLLGDARLGDLRLEGVDPTLGRVVELELRNHDRQHGELVADRLLHLRLDVAGQLVQAGRRGVAVVVNGEGVVGLEDGVQRDVELPGDQAVAHVLEAAVVLVQAADGVLVDAPLDGHVDAGDRLVGDAHVDARAVVVHGVLVRLDGGVVLGGLGPGRLEVQAVVERADGAIELGHDGDVLGRHLHGGGDAEEDHAEDGQSDGDRADGVAAVLVVAGRVVDVPDLAGENSPVDDGADGDETGDDGQPEGYGHCGTPWGETTSQVQGDDAKTDGFQ